MSDERLPNVVLARNSCEENDNNFGYPIVPGTSQYFDPGGFEPMFELSIGKVPWIFRMGGRDASSPRKATSSA